MATKTTSKSTSPAKGKRPSKPPAKLDGALMAQVPKSAPTHDEIAFRAFELYQLRGSDGGALHDWLAAEQELRAS